MLAGALSALISRTNSHSYSANLGLANNYQPKAHNGNKQQSHLVNGGSAMLQNRDVAARTGYVTLAEPTPKTNLL